MITRDHEHTITTEDISNSKVYSIKPYNKNANTPKTHSFVTLLYIFVVHFQAFELRDTLRKLHSSDNFYMCLPIAVDLYASENVPQNWICGGSTNQFDNSSISDSGSDMKDGVETSLILFSSSQDRRGDSKKSQEASYRLL